MRSARKIHGRSVQNGALPHTHTHKKSNKKAKGKRQKGKRKKEQRGRKKLGNEAVAGRLPGNGEAPAGNKMNYQVASASDVHK